jgi:uncharacterized protein involved in cysteine biosynthesis
MALPIAVTSYLELAMRAPVASDFSAPDSSVASGQVNAAGVLVRIGTMPMRGRHCTHDHSLRPYCECARRGPKSAQMIRAFSLAFGQLSDPALRRYVRLSALCTFAAFLAIWGFGLFVLFIQTEVPSFELLGYTLSLDTFADWIGALLLFLLLGLMFPSLLLVIVSFFLEDAARVVEARHYPNLGPARDQSVTETIRITLKFAALSIVLNLLALPIFLLLLFFPPFNLFVFYALNGYLLSREYYELVAYRRLAPPVADRMRKAVATKLFMVGVVIAVLMSVPVLNLVVPIVATAAMVHLVQDWRQRAGGGA